MRTILIYHLKRRSGGHNTKEIKNRNLGEEDMRRWWREKDFSSVLMKKLLHLILMQHGIVEMIYRRFSKMKDKGYY